MFHQPNDNELQTKFRTLTRMVAKGFYSPQEVKIIDLLIRADNNDKGVSTKELEDELKFDVRMLHDSLVMLKNDKIIYSRREYKSTSTRRSSQVLYFLKYHDLVNVVRYKLENVRKQVRHMERHSDQKPSFRCTVCGKTWYDHDASEILNIRTLTFECSICSGKIHEDTSARSYGSRDSMARFNQQSDAIYKLLQDIDVLLYYHSG